MAVISAFRHLPHHGASHTHPVPTSTVATEHAPRPETTATPRDGSGRDPVLTCRWEEGEDQYVQVEGETFHCGHMFMHWMPVH